MLTFNQRIKDTDRLRGLSWSLIGGCGRRKLFVRKVNANTKKQLILLLNLNQCLHLLKQIIKYGVVLFLKYAYVYVRTGMCQKNVTELFRRLNGARDLRFSLKCASFLPSDLNFSKNQVNAPKGHICSGTKKELFDFIHFYIKTCFRGR